MSGHEQLTPFAVFEKHRSDCTAGCTPWSVCAVGGALLERATRLAAERLAPMPPSPIVNDLPGHIAECEDCRGSRLCAVGMAIHDERVNVWLDYDVKRQDGPPC